MYRFETRRKKSADYIFVESGNGTSPVRRAGRSLGADGKMRRINVFRDEIISLYIINARKNG